MSRRMTFFSHRCSATRQWVNTAAQGCALTRCSGQASLKTNGWDATEQWAAYEQLRRQSVGVARSIHHTDFLWPSAQRMPLTWPAKYCLQFPPETHMILLQLTWELEWDRAKKLISWYPNSQKIRCHNVTVINIIKDITKYITRIFIIPTYALFTQSTNVKEHYFLL